MLVQYLLENFSRSIGDYIAGPNHVLPTSGSAKFPLVYQLMIFKTPFFNKITKSGIERLGPSVINLAKHENLQAHANSVKIRLKRKINWLNKKH